MDPERSPVSVVIANGDRDALIGAAVQSVLTQSYRNLEVIVIDGGASDLLAAALDALQEERLVRVRPVGGGSAAARNATLRAASGDYVAFLEPRDRYLPGKLALQVAYLDAHPDVDVVYTTAIGNDAAGGLIGKLIAGSELSVAVAFPAPVVVPLSTVMVRRAVLDAVGLCDERLDAFEDIDLLRRVVKHRHVGFIEESTAAVSRNVEDALRGQDPAAILGAYAYYIDKVERDDGDLAPLVRGAGARRLGERVAAMLGGSIPGVPYGDLLTHQAGRKFRPKVSIVIPVYNGANYLDQAIESALAQTYGNTEVIVVNDGSTDDGATERVARAFGDRIRYFAKPNGGVATALNRGIEEMTGDYFSWLSHDDLYLPDKLERQISALTQMPDPRRCALYSDFAIFTEDPDAATPYILPQVPPEDFRYFITTANGVHGCTLLVPRQAFEEHGRFDPTLRTTQDYDLWFRMAATFAFVHEPLILVRARSHSEQGTHALSHLVLGECNTLLSRFVEKLSEAEVRQGAPGPLAEGYFRLASNFARRGFLGARDRAAEFGRQHLLQSGPEGWQPFLEQGAAAQQIAELSATVKHFALQHQLLQEEVEHLRQELAVIYGSRSWRLTVPLRYFSKLAGRIAR
jgi:glycosyltransferase involved in cell wall biosynthesis